MYNVLFTTLQYNVSGTELVIIRPSGSPFLDQPNNPERDPQNKQPLAGTTHLNKKNSKMAPFYAYFPSSTAPRAPIATTTSAVSHLHPHNCTDLTHHHDSGLPCPPNNVESTHNGTHHHDSSLPCHLGGQHHDSSLPCPSHNMPTRLNLTSPDSGVCDGCEAPIMPELPPPSPASTNMSHVPCEIEGDASLQLLNGTVTGLPGLSQAQESSPDGPGYHSKQTGQVLLVVLFVAAGAVVVGGVYCIGMACWNYKMRKAETRPVTNV